MAELLNKLRPYLHVELQYGFPPELCRNNVTMIHSSHTFMRVMTHSFHILQISISYISMP